MGSLRDDRRWSQTYNTVNSLTKLGPHFCGREQRNALKMTHSSEVVIPERIVMPANTKKSTKKMRGGGGVGRCKRAESELSESSMTKFRICECINSRDEERNTDGFITRIIWTKLAQCTAILP